MKHIKYVIVLLILLLFLPSNNKAYKYVNPKNEQAIKDFRTDIYHLKDLYDELIVEDDEDGTSNTCTAVGSINKTCKGITVDGYGTYSLEEYVAGVLGGDEGWGPYLDNPALRYFIPVMVRTVAVAKSENCTKSISGTDMVQIFSTDTKTYLDAAKETAGIVLVDGNKSIITPGYSVTGLADCESISDGMCHITRYHRWDEKESYESIYPTKYILESGSIDVHHVGANPNDIDYKANDLNYSADQLAKYVFGDDATYASLSGTGSKVETSEGMNLACSDSSGEMVTVKDASFPAKNYNISGNNYSELKNNKYYNPPYAGNNIGQCPWYAQARAIEIINTSNISKDIKEKATKILMQTSGNGQDWYGAVNSALGSYFAYSNDINKPQPGSIVTWTGGQSCGNTTCGHVGIIEKVNSNGSVTLSDGWVNGGAYGTEAWGNFTVMTRDMTLEELKTYGGSSLNLKFEGYTYLFSYRK